MHKLIGSIVFLFIQLLPAFGQETGGSSTVTLGVGGAWALRSPHQLEGGPQFNGTYEYRVNKHFALEVGLDTTVTRATVFTSSTSTSTGLYFLNPGVNQLTTVTTTNYNFNTSIFDGARISAFPFGFRYILPEKNGRLEWSAGLGGAYFLGPNNYNEWAVTPSVGVRVAVDKGRHFWLGSTARFLNDFGAPAQGLWVTWTADLGFRFGH